MYRTFVSLARCRTSCILTPDPAAHARQYLSRSSFILLGWHAQPNHLVLYFNIALPISSSHVFPFSPTCITTAKPGSSCPNEPVIIFFRSLVAYSRRLYFPLNPIQSSDSSSLSSNKATTTSYHHPRHRVGRPPHTYYASHYTPSSMKRHDQTAFAGGP